MRRALLIAGREFIAYVRTVGFWLSLLLTPLGMVLFYGAPMLTQRGAPAVTVSVVNQIPDSAALDGLIQRRFSGEGGFRGGGRGGVPGAAPIRDELRLIAAPPEARTGQDAQRAGAAFQPYLSGEKQLGGARRLDVAAVIHRNAEGQTAIDFRTRTPAGDARAEGAVREGVSDWMRGEALREAGVNPGVMGQIERSRPEISRFSASGQGLGFVESRLPGIVSFALAMALFMMVVTGATILLNGVVEEKSSRILEVLLTSASPGEILFGKILGAAGIAGTVILAWGLVGGGVLYSLNPRMAADVGELLIGQGLMGYFAIYLVGGYVMYAAIFTAVGSFCETTREAQTLLGPLMLLLIFPVALMTQAISRPETPLLTALSWVPTFTPFLMMARVASHPPIWQVVGTAAVMIVTTAGVVTLGGRAFRAGALSSGKASLAGVIAKVREGE